MLTSRKTLLICLIAFLVPLLIVAQQTTEKVDLAVIHKIKIAEIGGGGRGGGGGGRGGEGRGGSQVMNIMYNLTDRYGPRLTNSPQFRRAGDWAVGQLKEWGLSNAHLEKWSTAGGRGGPIPSWEITGYSGAMVEPTYMPIIGYPQAWSGGTNGPITGEAILAQVNAPADLDKWHGKLKGKIVLTADLLDLPFPSTPLGRRYTDEELHELMPEILPTGGGGRGGRGGAGGPFAALVNMTPEERTAFQEKQRKFFVEEGALLTVTASARGQSGTVFASNGSPRTGDPTQNLPSVSITAENYNRIVRLLQHKETVKLAFDIKVKFDTSNTDSFNVIAEIPGATKPAEIVMVGGHFDSWHMGTGATDNAAGSAVAMEVMRMLKTLNLKMDRTVRLGLWGGEEEGLLGSAAYVKEHFADPATMKTTSEHDGFAGYFNVDNGTGRIRGVYLQENEMVRPIFEQWFAALKDLTPGVITIRNTGGTDHQSYDRVGLPGFQFIQDPMDYDTRTHHSNMDVYDRIQQADMEQMAIIEAVFVYNAATRPENFRETICPLPRRPRLAGVDAAAINSFKMEPKVFLALLVSLGLHAQPVSYRIDPLHSSAQFSVKHLMISTVRGQFGGVKGNILYDPQNPTAATVEATIDCSTVNTGEPKRDADLKTAEFFDVKKYPVMKFKSKRVESGGAGRLKLTGDLTINAVTREVILDLEGPTPPIRDAQGRDKIGVSGMTKISRKEFGITYNPILETGGVTVSDEVSIILEIELIKN